MTAKPAPNHPWRKYGVVNKALKQARELHSKAGAHRRHEAIMADPIYRDARLEQIRRAMATWRAKHAN